MTDHKAVAGVLLLQADAPLAVGSSLATVNRRHDLILSAQAHATLALVEQQRLALIYDTRSFLSEPRPSWSDVDSSDGERLVRYQYEWDAHEPLREQLREGLGL